MEEYIKEIERIAAQRAVKEGTVIFYPNTNEGLEDYSENRSDLCDSKDKENEWNKLDKVSHFDDYGNFLGTYRYDYFL